MILVTKPFLPPKEEVYELIDKIWESGWLTNNGPLVNQLESGLKDYLALQNLLYVNNGTIALQIAIKALELKGEIITTPFSFIATSSCIIWESCKPVYADICPKSFNIDPDLIEAAITPATTAILATHVFGNPCDIDAIEKIASKHKLKVIYDAAHCFGSLYKNKSVFGFGDISTTSFHATKIFHTVEGGALFCNSVALLEKMSFLRNFGYNGPTTFMEVGINGKNSELHAAIGLINLNYMPDILQKRKSQYQYYSSKLNHKDITFQEQQSNSTHNYSYMPLVFKTEEIVLKIIKELEINNIFPRRYFYPSLNTVPLFKIEQPCPVSEYIAKRIICLPLYHTLENKDIDLITTIILKELES
jgi:dTDP-4-amino-4,6-dideoxygalactose transaminase